MARKPSEDQTPAEALRTLRAVWTIKLPEGHLLEYEAHGEGEGS